MKILFVKRPNNYVSHLISKVTGEPESHVAIELDMGIVVDSSALGISLKPTKHFRSKTEVLRELVPVQRRNDKQVFEKVETYYGKFYDYGALAYLALVFTLRNYLKIPIPKSNLWQSSGLYMCTEFVAEVVTEKNDPMITPTKLGDKLIDSGKWKVL